MSADPFEQLEKNLHAALSGQPSLRAPTSLEQRVRDEIARQMARPWWQRSFSEWPMIPRAAFVALSGCAACISIAVTLTILNGPGAELAASFLQNFNALRTATQSVASSGVRMLGVVSPGWWYLAGAVVATAYVALLGIGATAYRLLWKDR